MIVTSTLRMQLDAAGFIKSAAQLAQAVEQDVKRLNDLKAALKDTGGTERLQASLQKLGASATHIEGVKRALAEQRQELGVVGVAWDKLTADQKKALRSVESTAVAVVRSEIAEEKRLTTALKAEADQRHGALLGKEQKLRDAILAQDRKAEDQRIAILAAAEAQRATVANRELVMRSAIEREITDKFKAEIRARENASEAELATIRRVAALEKETRVRAIADETSAIIAARHKQAEAEAEAVKHGQARAGIGHYVTGAVAGAVSVHGILRPAELALEAGSERQHVVVNARRAGMTPAEIVRAQDLATKLSREVGNMTATEVLELHKEARGALQHPEEAFEMMPELVRAASALKGMGAQGSVADIVKGGESLGLMGDKERFRRYLDSQVRAQGVLGKTINTEQSYEAAKYTKSSGATLSDEFLNLTMPSLIQELHGSSAGDAVSGLTKTLRGGLAHQHLAVTQLDKMGLLDDPSKIVRAKGSGEIMGYTGKVKGDALLATDPDRWFNEVWKPAAEKNMHAMTMADKNLLLSQTLPGKAANLGRIFIQQADTFAQHRVNFRNAPGTEEQIRLQREDPRVSVQAFTDALNDLGAAVTGPVMGSVGLGLSDLADHIRDIADAARANPKTALGLGAGATAVGLYGAGRLAYLVSTGFGLPAAAGQLSASAVALEAAAAKIGAGGVAGTAKDVVGAAAPGLGLASKLAIGVPLLGAGIFVTDAMLNHRDSSKALVDGGTPDVKPWDNNLGLPGYAVGGFTGPGSRNQPAGVVHAREFVVNASATERHRALLEAINRGDILPGYAQGGLVGGSGGVARVVLATDSSSTTALREVFGGAMYDALRRIRSEDGTFSGGSGGGGGEGAPSLRYGRGGDGAYRSTPGRQGVEGHAGSGTVRGGSRISGPTADSGHATRAGGNLARNQQEAYRAARAEGLSDVAARALVANMSGESLAKPNDYHYDRTHMSGGIVQWDPARSARIKEHFGKLPWQMSVTDQTRAAVWEMRTRPEYAATNRALQGTDPNVMIGTLVDNYERPQLREKAKRERLGYLHGFKPDAGGTYADEGKRGLSAAQREAERAVLPRRSEAAAPERHAGGVDFDTSSLREGIEHLRTFKAELSGLKGGVRIAIDHTHTHKGEASGRPGSLRTALNGGYASDGRSWT